MVCEGIAGKDRKSKKQYQATWRKKNKWREQKNKNKGCEKNYTRFIQPGRLCRNKAENEKREKERRDKEKVELKSKRLARTEYYDTTKYSNHRPL